MIVKNQNRPIVFGLRDSLNNRGIRNEMTISIIILILINLNHFVELMDSGKYLLINA